MNPIAASFERDEREGTVPDIRTDPHTAAMFPEQSLSQYGVRRRRVLRLAALGAPEQQRIMRPVYDHGHLPRRELPAKRRTTAVPIAPKAPGHKTLQRLGSNAAGTVMRSMERVLAAATSPATNQ